MIQYLPGEKEAIETVKALGAQYGYGNLIMQLKAAWSEMLQEKHGLKPDAAELGGGLVCVWCGVDCRTGKKQKRRPTKGAQ